MDERERRMIPDNELTWLVTCTKCNQQEVYYTMPFDKDNDTTNSLREKLAAFLHKSAWQLIDGKWTCPDCIKQEKPFDWEQAATDELTRRALAECTIGMIERQLEEEKEHLEFTLWYHVQKDTLTIENIMMAVDRFVSSIMWHIERYKTGKDGLESKLERGNDATTDQTSWA